MACRKWRQAFREHLRALSFEESGWYGFRCRSSSQMETLMSRTILQTTSLQSLTIAMRFYVPALPISALMSWLLHTRRSLRELILDVDSTDVFGVHGDMGLPLNVVDICKLEKLTLARGVVDEAVDPNYPRFSSLRSLSLVECVHVSDTGLRALLAASPHLESLELIRLDLKFFEENLKVVAPPSLRRFYVEGFIRLDSLIFESASVEHLHLNCAQLQSLKFIGKGTLTNLTIDNSSTVPDLEFCDSAASLESIDIIDSGIPRSELERLISKSSKLRKLRLWNVWAEATEAAGLETVAVSCPQLSHLYLSCDLLQDGKLFPYSLGGSTRFENMVYLKVGMSDDHYDRDEDVQDELFDLVEGLLDRCPSLKQLVVSGFRFVNCHRLCTRISRIRRKGVDSNVQLGVEKSVDYNES